MRTHKILGRQSVHAAELTHLPRRRSTQNTALNRTPQRKRRVTTALRNRQVVIQPLAILTHQTTPAPMQVEAKPQSLLKAWGCLSAALFAGAISSPVAADMQVPDLSADHAAASAAKKYYLSLSGGKSAFDLSKATANLDERLDLDHAKIALGKYFKPHWRWEMGYAQTSEGDSTGAGFKLPSVAIDYMLRQPEHALNFYLRGGVGALEKDGDGIAFEKESEVLGMLGGGAQWRFNDTVEARFGVEQFGEQATFASLSLLAKLGKRTQHAEEQHGEDPASVSEQSQAVTPQAAVEMACRSVDRELHGVSFSTGSAALSTATKRRLDNIAEVLKRGASIQVTVRGYTDSSGNRRTNQLLSQKRAQVVASYLALAVGNFNTPPRAIGMGASNPIASNDTAEGRSKNRRIELNLRAGKGCANESARNGAEVEDYIRLSTHRVALAMAQNQTPATGALAMPGTSVNTTMQSAPRSCPTINHVVEGIAFKVGEHDLNQQSKRALQGVVNSVRKDPSLRLTIKGHTDSIGLRANNVELSTRRAMSVADYLTSQATNIINKPIAIGAGETSPIASNDTAEGRALNRRIEVELTRDGGNCVLPVHHTAQWTPPQYKPRAVRKKPMAMPTAPIAKAPVAVEAPVAVAAAPVAIAESVLPIPASDVVDIELPANEPEQRTAALSVVEEQESSETCGALDLLATGVKFDNGGIKLDQQARTTLDAFNGYLKIDRSIDVVVEAHTDNSGSVHANMELSEVRAKAVAAYITGGAGLAKNPPVPMGFGHAKPVHSNSTVAGRMANRRIVLKLSGGHGCLPKQELLSLPGLEKVVENTSPFASLSALMAETPAGDIPQTGALNIAPAPSNDGIPQTGALSVAPSADRTTNFESQMQRVAQGQGACGKIPHVVEKLNFATGAYKIDSDGKDALMPLVELWKNNPDLALEVRGYTDDQGNNSDNRRLSQQRAQQVAKFLKIESGQYSGAVTATGLGEFNPRATNSNSEGRSLNRRIEITINGGKNCNQGAALMPHLEPLTEEATKLSAASAWLGAAQKGAAEIVGGGGMPNAPPDSCEEIPTYRTSVAFGTDSASIAVSTKLDALDSLVNMLNADPQLQVEVQGHTDSVGSAAFNDGLSVRRADAAASYILQRTGNFSNPPIAVGYGESQPVASNDTAEGRAKNRRIDILVRSGQACNHAAQAYLEDEVLPLALQDLPITASELAQWTPVPMPIEVAQVEPEPISDETLFSSTDSQAPPVLDLAKNTYNASDLCHVEQRILNGVSFAASSFKLDAVSKRSLQEVAEVLVSRPELRYKVQGHTDAQGSEYGNKNLSLWRARSVAKYLTEVAGSNGQLLDAEGFGEGRPLASNDTEAGRSVNRRVELELLDTSCSHLA